MKNRYYVLVVVAQLAGFAGEAAAAAAQSRADVVPSIKRQVTVDLAAQLTQPPTPKPVPDDLRSMFNPPGFNAPAVKAAQPSAGGAPTVGAAAAPVADRDILEALALRIPSTGTVTTREGTTQLVVGRNRLQVGNVFTVTYNNQDYDLELIAIDRTTFTLRYRNEETTRPIKSK